MNEAETKAARGHVARARHAAALLVVASLVALFGLPSAAGAQVPQPPPNGNCEGTAVVVKLGVVEDRAAANMLVEAAASLGLGQRCLVDAGDPRTGRVPSESRNELSDADQVYVVGGPAAIPDSWLRSQLGVSSFTRIAGGNRWETQAAVAEAIISLARGEPATASQGQPGSSPDLPPNTGCTNAVLVKLNVVEDRAAANMLAETFNHLSADGDDRCLVDVGDPQKGLAPAPAAVANYAEARTRRVVGGIAAIPDSWLDAHFGKAGDPRLAGADRWATQAAVARQILSLTTPPQAEDVTLTRDAARPLGDVALVAAPTEATLRLPVYYCGDPANYTTQLLDQRIRELSAVAEFFLRESGGRAKIVFTRGSTNGGLLSAPGIAQQTNVHRWYQDDQGNPRESRVHDQCLEGAVVDQKNIVLILADARGGGYAYPPGDPRQFGGPAVVATPERSRGGVSEFLGVAAHEIAHAFYALKHPWLDHPYLCKLIDEIEQRDDHGDSSLSPRDQSLCGAKSAEAPVLSEEKSGHLLGSIVSYVRYGAIRDLRPGHAYLACYQRAEAHLGWADPDKCIDEGEYSVGAPDPPLPPVVRAETEGLSVEWSAPDANGADIRDYDLQFRLVGSNRWEDVDHDGTHRQSKIVGLNAATDYVVRIRATNRVGTSPWSTPTEVTTLGSSTTGNPRVHLSRGDRVRGNPDCTGDACYWLHVELEDFPDGAHTLACAHNGVHQLGIGRGVFHSAIAAVSNDSPSTRVCFFGYPGNQVFVIVGAERRDGAWHGGTYSNIVDWQTTVPPPPSGTLIDDDPALTDKDGTYSWWKPPANVDLHGYGANGFHFTLAIGNSGDDDTDNLAQWEFPAVDGEHEVQVWIPAEWAAAHVQYRIWADSDDDGRYSSQEYVAGPWLDQAVDSGWQTLGTYDLKGSVMIEVRDTRARDDWNDVGAVGARLAVDAIQLVPKRSGPAPPRADVYDDDPYLVDEEGSYSWWKPPAEVDRLGYGANGFHFTLAAGNAEDAEIDNWARWDFRAVDGRYEVEVWVPADWATAHVQYLIRSDTNGDGQFSADEYIDAPWLDQQAVSGWQSIGTHDFYGPVRIEVWDTRARDDWNDVGAANARLAVDAIRLRPAS